MGHPYTMNNMTQLWDFLVFSQMIANKISEYVKLVEIVMVQMIGFIHTKRCFNNMNFINSKLLNHLTTYFMHVIQMFV
jgi:hypothetical protein